MFIHCFDSQYRWLEWPLWWSYEFDFWVPELSFFNRKDKKSSIIEVWPSILRSTSILGDLDKRFLNERDSLSICLFTSTYYQDPWSTGLTSTYQQESLSYTMIHAFTVSHMRSTLKASTRWTAVEDGSSLCRLKKQKSITEILTLRFFGSHVKSVNQSNIPN